MDFKKLGDIYFVKIEKGEEVYETLKEFCKKQKITAGTISGLGAVNKIELVLYNTKDKKYYSKIFSGEDFEIASLTGNTTTMDKEAYLHLHIVISDKDMKAYAGHMKSAVVSAACEVVIITAKGVIEREYNEEIGLNLLKLK